MNKANKLLCGAAIAAFTSMGPALAEPAEAKNCTVALSVLKVVNRTSEGVPSGMAKIEGAVVNCPELKKIR